MGQGNGDPTRKPADLGEKRSGSIYIHVVDIMQDEMLLAYGKLATAWKKLIRLEAELWIEGRRHMRESRNLSITCASPTPHLNNMTHDCCRRRPRGPQFLPN